MTTLESCFAGVVTFRKLRAWHWWKMLEHRSRERNLNSIIEAMDEKFDRHIRNVYLTQSKRVRADADMHLKAVQLLNDLPECRDATAEDDLREYLKEIQF